MVIKGERAHHPTDAVGIGQMEGCCHFVLPGGLVVQHGTRVSLVIVVVHKGQGLTRGQESPIGSPALQPFQCVVATEGVANLLGESELGDGTQILVLITGDGFVTVINYLLEDEGTGVVRKAVIDVQVAQAAVDVLRKKTPLTNRSKLGKAKLTSRSSDAICLAASTRKPATPSSMR